MLSPEPQLTELTRGEVDLVQGEELLERLREDRPLKIEAGFDPMRPDVYLGHTALMQKMRQFQSLGHAVRFLIGDFTAMVGDPNGQNEMRPWLTREQLLAAAKTHPEQAFRVLDPARWSGAILGKESRNSRTSSCTSCSKATTPWRSRAKSSSAAPTSSSTRWWVVTSRSVTGRSPKS